MTGGFSVGLLGTSGKLLASGGLQPARARFVIAAALLNVAATFGAVLAIETDWKRLQESVLKELNQGNGLVEFLP